MDEINGTGDDNNEAMYVFRCPYCACKHAGKFRGAVPSVEELCCSRCILPACHYSYGEEDHQRHLEIAHGLGGQPKLEEGYFYGN